LTVAPVATFSTLFARVIVKASAPWSTIRCLQARLVPQAKLALQARLVPQAQSHPGLAASNSRHPRASGRAL
jgi:hypothetical protein